MWTTIYLSDISAPPLLDMIIAYAGDRLLRVYVDHPDINRGEKLWKFIDRIEELDFSYGTGRTFSFLSSLGPAPNLKLLKLRDEGQDSMNDNRHRLAQHLPKAFQGFLPSLRELHLAVVMTWPAGLFKDLRSLELGSDARDIFDPILVLDVLRESPLLESIRLTGHCSHFDEEPPAVALSSLRNCTLTGFGAIFLIWYMDIPASANVSLDTPPSIGSGVHLARDLSLAPCLHVLDQISTVSFYIGFDTIEFRVENDSGGSFNLEVYYYETLEDGLSIYFVLLKDFFRGCHPKSPSPKVFSLQIEQGASRDDLELVLCATIFLRSICETTSLERMVLRGVPVKALTFHFEFLHVGLTTIPFPNLQQIQVETPPLHSPRLLLERLDVLLKKRKDSGIPPRLVDMKVNCEELIPMAEHSAFLTAWKDLVAEDVRVEYFRDSVDMSEDEEDGDDDSGEVGGAESGSCDSDWGSWASGKWPKAASETRGLMGM